MAATQAERRDELTRETVEWLRRRYPLAAELSLIPPNAGQVPAYNAFRGWVGDVFVELATALDAVDAAPNQGVWDAVTVDFATLAASDPGLELEDFVRL